MVSAGCEPKSEIESICHRLARARDPLMPRNFGFQKPVDQLDQWPLAILVAAVLLIVAVGFFIA
jgi:hypothetical protein